jgi:hypothetical protein
MHLPGSFAFRRTRWSSVYSPAYVYERHGFLVREFEDKGALCLIFGQEFILPGLLGIRALGALRQNAAVQFSLSHVIDEMNPVLSLYTIPVSPL